MIITTSFSYMSGYGGITFYAAMQLLILLELDRME